MHARFFAPLSSLLLVAILSVGCRTTGPIDVESRLPVARLSTDPETGMRSTDNILSRSRLPPTLSEPLAGDAMGVEIHHLSNGMTVYISTDRKVPMISTWIAIRAGSRHDPPDSTGLAHYLEHMLFKGTDEFGTLDYQSEKENLDRIAELYDELRTTDDDERRREIFAAIDQETQKSSAHAIPNELDRLYGEIGVAGLNAFTDDEATVYIASVPANRFDAWATVEAERFRDAVFRLFFPELEAVYEEKNRALDSPGRRMSEALLGELFPRHPYGTQTTIGRIEHLKSPAYGDMVDFYQRWYVPNNMAILLAGDIDAETALPVLEGLFGDWRPKPLSPPAAGRLTELPKRVEREIKAEGEESLIMAWPTFPVGHEDDPALSVLDLLMDNAESGLLNLELEVTQKLPEAGSFPTYYNEAGFWAMRASVRQDQTLEEAEQMLLEVLAKLKRGDFDQSDIDAILLHEEMSDKRQLESNRARVAKMANAYLSFQSWPDVLTRDKRLLEVTKEDVLEVAERYLGDDYAIVFRRRGKPDLPKIDKPTITAVPLDVTRASSFASDIADMKVVQLEPVFLEEGQDYVRREIDGGELIAVVNERNDLFNLSYRFERGYREEPLLCYALALFELSGAGELSASDLKRKLYGLGTSVRTGCGDERSSLAISGIDRNMDQSLALVEGWFREPSFTNDDIAKLLKTVLSGRKDEMDDPRSLAGALRDFVLNGDRSSRLARPSNASLRAATNKELHGLITRFVDHQYRVHYFGPRSAADAVTAAAIGVDHRPLEPPPPDRMRSIDGAQIFFMHKDVVKSDVMVAIPHPPLARDLRPVASAYSEYLGGGMNALIPQEIREARGLAYSAWAFYSVGARPQDDSGLVSMMQTQVDKTVGALDALLELLRERPLSGVRLRSAKLALDQGYRTDRTDPRFVASQVLAWDLAGEESDPRLREWQQIITLAEEVAGKFALESAQGPILIAIQGNRERLDLDALREIAPVEEITPEQLFRYGSFEEE